MIKRLFLCFSVVVFFITLVYLSCTMPNDSDSKSSKKSSSSFISLSSSTSSSSSSIRPEKWTFQNPLPTGNSLYSILFVNANTDWAVGESGTILKYSAN